MKIKETCRVERKGVDVDYDDDGVDGGRGGGVLVVVLALLKRCQKHCQKEFLIRCLHFSLSTRKFSNILETCVS